MSSVINYEVCPYCGCEDYVVDYYYRTDEMYGFCPCCGSRHNITLRRDENGHCVFGAPKHYNFSDIAVKAVINDETIAVATINNKADFDIYNNWINKSEEFEKRFGELCEAVTAYILARPEEYASVIEDYKRGCYSDGSGDKNSVALWRNASIRIVCNDEPFIYLNTKIDFDETGMLISECDYIDEETIGYGTYSIADENGSSVFTFESEPTDAELQELIDAEFCHKITVVKNGKIEIIKSVPKEEMQICEEDEEYLPF